MNFRRSPAASPREIERRQRTNRLLLLPLDDLTMLRQERENTRHPFPTINIIRLCFDGDVQLQ
jgi:hypothetical protein